MTSTSRRGRRRRRRWWVGTRRRTRGSRRSASRASGMFFIFLFSFYSTLLTFIYRTFSFSLQPQWWHVTTTTLHHLNQHLDRYHHDENKDEGLETQMCLEPLRPPRMLTCRWTGLRVATFNGIGRHITAPLTHNAQPTQVWKKFWDKIIMEIYGLELN